LDKPARTMLSSACSDENALFELIERIDFKSLPLSIIVIGSLSGSADERLPPSF
jgi:hypothetical protein